MNILIGCSGFHYPEWKDRFYPRNLPKSEWLEFYAKKFNTVEINNTFYITPSAKSMDSWMKSTPEGFKFSVKANRYFTHMKKLNVDEDFKNRYKDFQESLQPLNAKLGCVLWQLPGNIQKNVSKLKSFIDVLNKDHLNVIEFRHESWFTQDIFSMLHSAGVILCMVSSPKKLPEVAMATHPVGYLRFHGKDTWYDYDYSKQELLDWKAKIDKLDISDLYIYFNNDIDARAPNNAGLMEEIMQHEYEIKQV